MTAPATHIDRHAKSLSWRQEIEPWYLAYGLQGVTVAGIAPILLPLWVSRDGSATSVGLVMAAFSLGGLTAPLWGWLADRNRLHRLLLVGGLLTTSLGMAAFPFTNTLIMWLALALLQGVGAASAATVANLFVVEAHPRAEWDERIGWLQTFYGGGQVAGLLLAGIISRTDLRAGLLTATGMTGAAFLVGWFTSRTPSGPRTPKPVLLRPARNTESALGSPQHLFHHLTIESWRQLGPAVLSPFGFFLILWFLSFAGSLSFFSLYPVLMEHAYGVSPRLSSIGFAVAAGLGLVLYTPAGRWAERIGAMRVLRYGLGVRVLAFFGLWVLGFFTLVAQSWLALLGFAFVVLSWSLLTVSATTLTAQLSPVGEGAGMGFFSALTALAGVIGAVIGGFVAGRWSYHAVSIVGLLGVSLGLLLSVRLVPTHNVNEPAMLSSEKI